MEQQQQASYRRLPLQQALGPALLPALIPGLISAGTGAAALALRPKLPKPPTPPSASQDITRPQSSFFSSNQGNANGTFFGGTGGGPGGAQVGGSSGSSASPGSPSGKSFLGS